jgi:predicted component of type VI protein secretion system
MKLVALEGFSPGAEYALGPTPLTFGRAPGCSVIVDDDDVSREHCRIRSGGDGYILEDLGSRNGTVVNGRQVTEPIYLQPGDLIVIGPALFEVRASAPARSTPPPQPRIEAVARPPATPAGVARAAREAALAARRVQQRLASAGGQLDRVESSAGRLATALSHARRAGGEPEARRLLAVCRSAARDASPEQLAGTLGPEAATLHRTVSAALDLLEAIRRR